MIAKDHKLLGVFLVRRLMKNPSFAAKRLFLWGCVLPDRNPLTYLRGIYLGHPLKTHFVAISRPEIHRLCSKLEHKRKLFLWDYYSLGALTHYVADAFTFPHNAHYHGGLLNHARYEESTLHPLFETYIAQNNEIPSYDVPVTVPLKEVFEQMHTVYANSEPSPIVDAEWIVRACLTVGKRILKKDA